MINKVLNYIFYCIVILVILNSSFNIFKPFLVNILYNDSTIENNQSRINELKECIEQYTDSIKEEDYEKANIDCAVFNKKSNKTYNLISTLISQDKEYIIKYAYNLYDTTYRCYAIPINELSSSIEDNIDKSDMNIFVVKLDRENSNYEIIYDKFN